MADQGCLLSSYTGDEPVSRVRIPPSPPFKYCKLLITKWLYILKLFHSHIFNPISTGVSKPSLVSQLGSPSRRTATVKCATIILRDEFESLCERGLPLFFLEHGACAGDRIDDFVGDQLCRLARSGGGGDVRIDPLLGFLQVELALDMPGLVSRATARASRSVLLDLFIDIDEASRRFSEAVIMGLERSQDPTHVRDKTEAAYRRTDLFDRRRDLMESWSRFATSTPAGTMAIRA